MSNQSTTPQNPNPVVIRVNEQGASLIKAVCSSALKQAGIEALSVVNTILVNMRDIPVKQPEPPQNDEPKKEPEKKGN